MFGCTMMSQRLSNSISKTKVPKHAATERVGPPPNFAFSCVLTLISENYTW